MTVAWEVAVYQAWNVVERDSHGERVIVKTVEYYSGDGPAPWDPRVRVTLPQLSSAPTITRQALERRLRQLGRSSSQERDAHRLRSCPRNGYLPMKDWEDVLAERVA